MFIKFFLLLDHIEWPTFAWLWLQMFVERHWQIVYSRKHWHFVCAIRWFWTKSWTTSTRLWELLPLFECWLSYFESRTSGWKQFQSEPSRQRYLRWQHVSKSVNVYLIPFICPVINTNTVLESRSFSKLFLLPKVAKHQLYIMQQRHGFTTNEW